MAKMLNKVIFLTFDLDWAGDKILHETIEILQSFKLKATFFATHDSQLLKTLPSDRFEIGLHPNFDLGDGKYDIKALEKLNNIYPESIGTRSHSLFFTSRLLKEIENCNLKYESNMFLWRHNDLHKTHRSKSVVSIPFNWSDDKHIELNCDFNIKTFPSLDQKGLNVFNFHPVHVFLNTDNYFRYEDSKKYFNKSKMIDYKNISGFGIRTLLINLCEHINEKNYKTGLMRDIYNE